MLLQCKKTHFTCGADCRVLEKDFNVFFSIWQSCQRWGFLASSTQPWCRCWRCFCRWREVTSCGRCCREKFQVFVWLRKGGNVGVVLVVSSQDLPHPHYFLYLSPCPQSTFTEDLEHSYVYIKILSPACINPFRARPVISFTPVD